MITSTDRDALIDGRYDRGRLEQARTIAKRILPAELTPSKEHLGDASFDVAFMDAMLGEYLAYAGSQGDEDELEKAQLLVRMSQDYLAGVDVDFLPVDTRFRDILEKRPKNRSVQEFVEAIPSSYPKILRREAKEQHTLAVEASDREFTKEAERYHDIASFIKQLHTDDRLPIEYAMTLLVMLGFEAVNGRESHQGYRKVRTEFKSYLRSRRQNLVLDEMPDNDDSVLREGLGYLDMIMGPTPTDQQQGFNLDVLVGYNFRRFNDLAYTRKHVAARLGYALDVLVD